MRWSDEITLLKPSTDPADNVNENGFAEDMPCTPRVVFCNKKSVGHSEFYKSRQQGQYVRFKFDIYTEEYDGERLAEYNGVRYTILRTYELNNGEITELTLSDIVAGTGV